MTDHMDKPLWSGGMIVRSDGNNFIAELAAAAIAVKACPESLSMSLRIDSLATIGAIQKGPLSERKRIRAAGRAWLNLCREDFARKKLHIHLQHVSSHKGVQTPEQIGNDVADRLANDFRRQGETVGPVPYFTATEETLFL